jgi:filamentous hemagglutinin family protein
MNTQQRSRFTANKGLVFASALVTCMVAPGAHAQVVLDGTLGSRGALKGPDYQIGAKLGQQRGGNLFHSFSDFNINTGESATFSGPNSVQNIISRVTGGNPSRINGILRSKIPNADFYFINPYGILFGEDAQLDVQGSFYASTADTLRFADGKKFNARQPEQSLLTVAPTSAFGFLDAPAPLTVQGTKLSVPEGEILSLIGGLHIDGEPPFYDDKGKPTVNAAFSAGFWHINLASAVYSHQLKPLQPILQGFTWNSASCLRRNRLCDHCFASFTIQKCRW